MFFNNGAIELSKEETLALRRFVQSIINAPHPIDCQPHERKDGKMYCDDWEIIEICKYLFNGREGYYGDPPPNRLKNNPLWSKEDVEKKAEALIQKYNVAEGVILALRKRREEHGKA